MQAGDRVEIRVSEPWDISEANDWPKPGIVRSIETEKPRIVAVIRLDQPIIVPGGVEVRTVAVLSRYRGDEDLRTLSRGQSRTVHVWWESSGEAGAGLQSAHLGYGPLTVL